jgi:hypothetical protein
VEKTSPPRPQIGSTSSTNIDNTDNPPPQDLSAPEEEPKHIHSTHSDPTRPFDIHLPEREQVIRRARRFFVRDERFQHQ